MPESPLIDLAAHKVMAQASCTYNDARELMRVSRAQSGKTLLEVAEAVIDRSLRFDGVVEPHIQQATRDVSGR
jgi:hypothetical protein